MARGGDGGCERFPPAGSKVRICIELGPEEYAALRGMLEAFPEKRSVEELVRDVVLHNVRNFASLSAKVRSILEEVLPRPSEAG